MKFTFIIITLLVVVLAFDLVRGFILAKRSQVLIRSLTPFSRNLPNAPMRILVVGDSTAYGTGSDSPTTTTAGRLGEMYPQASVTNLAVNGLKIEGLLAIFEKIDLKTHYDIVLIQIGANDIIRLTSIDRIHEGIKKVLERAQKFGGKVILLHSGNVGEAPFFPWYLRPILSSRSLEVRDIYTSEVGNYSAEYVDLINSPVAKLLRDDIKKYYSNDMLHLTGDGYGLWFNEIKKHL